MRVFCIMQQIYRKVPMQKCDFDKAAMQLFWSHISAWVFSILEEHLSGTASGFIKFYYKYFFRILWNICNLLNLTKHQKEISFK